MMVKYHEPVNLGNPDEFTMLELVDIIKMSTGINTATVFKELPIDDPRQRRPDINVSRIVIDYTPCTNLRTGIIRVLEN